jgi:competence protein ComEA
MKWLHTIIMSMLLSLSAFAAQPVNVNTADAETIADSLSGVGLSKAQAIVAYREAHGTFKHADELVNVKGIGLRTIDKNREYILVNQQDAKKS